MKSNWYACHLPLTGFGIIRMMKDLKCTAKEYIDFTSDGLMISIGYIEEPSEPIFIQTMGGK